MRNLRFLFLLKLVIIFVSDIGYHDNSVLYSSNKNQRPVKWLISRFIYDKIYSIYLEFTLPPSLGNVTIVTAYYRMSSKHSNEEYLSWMSNFLTLQDCMVIFTQPDFVSTIQMLRPADYLTIIKAMELNQE